MPREGEPKRSGSSVIEDGTVEWVGSEYLEFEVGQDPDGERVKRIRSLLVLVRTRVPASEAVARRARAIDDEVGVSSRQESRRLGRSRNRGRGVLLDLATGELADPRER